MTENPQQSQSVRFAVHDLDGNDLGVLAVNAGTDFGVPRLSVDVNRPIRRTVTNIAVPPRPLGDVTASLYAGEFSTLTTEVRPYFTIDGVEHQTGVLGWGDASTAYHSYGNWFFGELVDRSAILNDGLEASVSYPAGTNVRDALVEQAALGGFGDDRVTIEASGVSLGAPLTGAAGRDTRWGFMETLATAGGYLPPYFDNDGLLVIRYAPNVETAEATALVYGGSGRVIEADSLVGSDDLLAAPNRYQVIAGGLDHEVIGIFDLPAQAPNSFENTGRRRTRTLDIDGIPDEFIADLTAAGEYAADTTTYSWIAFTSPPYPDHDCFDIIAVDGTYYREQAWSLDLVAGGAMRHDARGVYG